MKRSADEMAAVNEAEASKKAKQLPPNYKCKICGVENEHAVYNCPLKIKKKDLVVTETGEVCRPVVVNKTVAVNNVTEPKYIEDNSLTVYISGLPFDITKDDLIYYLTGVHPTNTELVNLEPPLCKCTGELKFRSVKLVMFDDNSHKCKGIAFVKLANIDDLNTCLAASEKMLNNRVIKIVKSINKPAPVVEAAPKRKQKGCYRCGQLHDATTCTNPRICYRCKSTEHISSNCPLKKSSK